MKWTRNLVTLLATVALVAGCASAPKSPSAPTPAPEAPKAEAPKTEAPKTEAPAPQKPANPEVILATTTSTQDSGLLDALIPVFEEKTGYEVKTIAVGTGQALKLGENGEADVLLVHAPASEKPLVEAGVAINRRLIMHNDFIIAGPAADPANLKSTKKASEALKLIAQANATFASRGDDSGTHKMELSLWKLAGVEPAGDWYLSAGQGMGATLKIADEKEGYVLTDRATYLAQKPNLKLEILLEGDAPLLNIYHVMEVNKAKFEKVNAEGGKAFADFLLTQEAQEMIKNFGVDKFGQPLFFPDGGKVETDLTGK